MKITSKWKEEYLFYIYDLIKDGHSGAETARILGVSSATWDKWKKRNPLVQVAMACGQRRMNNKNNSTPTFKRYIFGRLSKKLQKLWTKIDAIDMARTGYEETLQLLNAKPKRVRQHLFLYAWTQSNFSISTALRKVCISRATFEKWKQDPDFQDLVEEIGWHKKNFFEDALLDLVKDHDSSATIFANRTQNADRGYNEKMTVDHKVSGSINVNIIDIDKLGLPLAIRKMILQKVREMKQLGNKEVKSLPASTVDNIGVPAIVEGEKVEAHSSEGKEK